MKCRLLLDKDSKCIRTFFKRSPAMHPINIRHPVQFADGMRSAAVPATPNAGAGTPSLASKTAFPADHRLCGIDFLKKVHREAFYFCKTAKMLAPLWNASGGIAASKSLPHSR